jgi:hypothetical protein
MHDAARNPELDYSMADIGSKCQGLLSDELESRSPPLPQDVNGITGMVPEHKGRLKENSEKHPTIGLQGRLPS